MNVVLCGMPGAGKTTVGKELRTLTGRNLLDTDEEIIKNHGAIAGIFDRYGETYFRDLETEVAKRLSEEDGLIVSTGGGFTLREENVNYLKRGGKIFYLRTSLAELVRRVAKDDARPLLRGDAREKITALATARTPVYEKIADHIVDTDGKTSEEIAREILRLAEATGV